jgi:hypothetical protein
MGQEAEWGFEQPGDLDRVLLLSPHLDDAVISCGVFLLAHPGTTLSPCSRPVPRRTAIRSTNTTRRAASCPVTTPWPYGAPRTIARLRSWVRRRAGETYWVLQP